jgi:hypothetical protein
MPATRPLLDRMRFHTRQERKPPTLPERCARQHKRPPHFGVTPSRIVGGVEAGRHRCAYAPDVQPRGAPSPATSKSSAARLKWSATRAVNPARDFQASRPVSRATKSSAARLKWSATRAVNPARDFQASRPVSRATKSSAARLKWSGRRASNPLPRPWQGRALPSELLPLG